MWPIVMPIIITIHTLYTVILRYQQFQTLSYHIKQRDNITDFEHIITKISIETGKCTF